MNGCMQHREASQPSYSGLRAHAHPILYTHSPKALQTTPVHPQPVYTHPQPQPQPHIHIHVHAELLRSHINPLMGITIWTTFMADLLAECACIQPGKADLPLHSKDSCRCPLFSEVSVPIPGQH